MSESITIFTAERPSPRPGQRVVINGIAIDDANVDDTQRAIYVNPRSILFEIGDSLTIADTDYEIIKTEECSPHLTKVMF